MGRGRAKAKQQKVARELKYHTQFTDLDALQRDDGATCDKGAPLPSSDFHAPRGSIPAPPEISSVPTIWRAPWRLDKRLMRYRGESALEHCSSVPRGFDQPHFRDVTTATVVAKARLAEPIQRQFTAFSRFGRELVFQRIGRNRLWHERMNFDVVARHQSDFATRLVARVNDAQLVIRARIELVIMQSQRFVIKR